jgi:hypothetical protein
MVAETQLSLPQISFHAGFDLCIQWFRHSARLHASALHVAFCVVNWHFVE